MVDIYIQDMLARKVFLFWHVSKPVHPELNYISLSYKLLIPYTGSESMNTVAKPGSKPEAMEEMLN